MPHAFWANSGGALFSGASAPLKATEWRIAPTQSGRKWAGRRAKCCSACSLALTRVVRFALTSGAERSIGCRMKPRKFLGGGMPMFMPSMPRKSADSQGVWAWALGIARTRTSASAISPARIPFLIRRRANVISNFRGGGGAAALHTTNRVKNANAGIGAWRAMWAANRRRGFTAGAI